MKKTLKYLGLLFCANLLVISSLSAQSFTIEGTVDMDVEGLENGRIELFEFDNIDSKLTQKTTIVDGKFSFKGHTPHPKLMCLYTVIDEGVNDGPAELGSFILTNDTYEIHITKNDFTVVSSSKEQLKNQEFSDLRDRTDEALNALFKEYQDKIALCVTEDEKKEVNNWARDKDFELNSKYQDESIQWLEENLDTHMGVQLFYMQFMRNIRKRQAEELFAKIPEQLHQNKYYQSAKLWLDARNTIKVGKEAPQASVYDIYGNAHPLLEKGKAQVIYFGVRDMIFYEPFERFTKIYNQYKDKDLSWKAVVNGEREDWIRYLTLDPLPYATYLTDSNRSTGLFNLYNINTFGSVLIVDENNVILYLGSYHETNWDDLLNK